MTHGHCFIAEEMHGVELLHVLQTVALVPALGKDVEADLTT